MKKLLPTLSLLVLLISCTSQKNSKEFIKETSGRYLFNANEDVPNELNVNISGLLSIAVSSNVLKT